MNSTTASIKKLSRSALALVASLLTLGAAAGTGETDEAGLSPYTWLKFSDFSGTTVPNHGTGSDVTFGAGTLSTAGYVFGDTYVDADGVIGSTGAFPTTFLVKMDFNGASFSEEEAVFGANGQAYNGPCLTVSGNAADGYVVGFAKHSQGNPSGGGTFVTYDVPADYATGEHIYVMTSESQSGYKSLYVDGELIGTDNTIAYQGSQNNKFSFGRASNAGSRTPTGLKMTEFRAYASCLTAEQVALISPTADNGYTFSNVDCGVTTYGVGNYTPVSMTIPASDELPAGTMLRIKSISFAQESGKGATFSAEYLTIDGTKSNSRVCDTSTTWSIGNKLTYSFTDSPAFVTVGTAATLAVEQGSASSSSCRLRLFKTTAAEYGYILLNTSMDAYRPVYEIVAEIATVKAIEVTDDTTTAEINTLGAGFKNLELTIPAGKTISFTDALDCDSLKVKSADGVVKLSADSEPADYSKLSGAVFIRSWVTQSIGGVISINFGSGSGEVSGQKLDGSLAGDIPAFTWHNSSSAKTTLALTKAWDAANCVETTLSDVSATWSTSGTYSYTSGVTVNFLKGYLDENASTTPSISVTGIPYDNYDVIIYAATDGTKDARHFHAATVNGSKYTCGANGLGTVTTADGAYWGANGHSAPEWGVNAMRVAGLSGDLTITTGPNASSSTIRGCVAAIQIVESNPVAATEIETAVDIRTSEINAKAGAADQVTLKFTATGKALIYDEPLECGAISVSCAGALTVKSDKTKPYTADAADYAKISLAAVTGPLTLENCISFVPTSMPSYDLTITGTDALAAIPYMSSAHSSVLTLDCPVSDTAGGQIVGTKSIVFGANFTMTASKLILGNQSSVTQNFTQNGGTITLTDATATASTSCPLVFAHWNATVKYNLLGGTLSVPNGLAVFGWDGLPTVTVGGGDSTATLSAKGFGFNSGHMRDGALEVKTNGRVEVGSLGFSLASNKSVTLSGGTFAATADATFTVAHASGLQVTADSYFETAAGCTATFASAIGGSGKLTITGAGVFKPTGETTVTYALDGGTLDAGTGLTGCSLADGASGTIVVTMSGSSVDVIPVAFTTVPATLTVKAVNSQGAEIAGKSVSIENGVLKCEINAQTLTRIANQPGDWHLAQWTSDGTTACAWSDSTATVSVTAIVDADTIDSLTVDSDVSAYCVQLKSTSEKSFTLAGAATLTSDIDATSFAGSLNLVAPVVGQITLGDSATAYFSATDETICPCEYDLANDKVLQLTGGGRVVYNFQPTKKVNILAGTTLVIDVPEGETWTVSAVISGAGKLVKAGKGRLILSGKNTYSGGTTIEAGAIEFGVTSSSAAEGPIGPYKNDTSNWGANAVVKSGATLDIHGKYDMTYVVELEAGATLQNAGGTIDSGKRQVKKIILSGDAAVDCGGMFGLHGGGNAITYVDLNGHTLTKTGSGIFELVNTTFNGEGALRVEGGQLLVNTLAVTGSQLDLYLAAGVTNKLSKNLTIRDFTPAAGAKFEGDGVLTVGGVFDASAWTSDLTLPGALALADGASLKLGTGVLKPASLTVAGATLAVDAAALPDPSSPITVIQCSGLSSDLAAKLTVVNGAELSRFAYDATLDAIVYMKSDSPIEVNFNEPVNGVDFKAVTLGGSVAFGAGAAGTLTVTLRDADGETVSKSVEVSAAAPTFSLEFTDLKPGVSYLVESSFRITGSTSDYQGGGLVLVTAKSETAWIDEDGDTKYAATGAWTASEESSVAAQDGRIAIGASATDASVKFMPALTPDSDLSGILFDLTAKFETADSTVEFYGEGGVRFAGVRLVADPDDATKLRFSIYGDGAWNDLADGLEAELNADYRFQIALGRGDDPEIVYYLTRNEGTALVAKLRRYQLAAKAAATGSLVNGYFDFHGNISIATFEAVPYRAHLAMVDTKRYLDVGEAIAAIGTTGAELTPLWYANVNITGTRGVFKVRIQEPEIDYFNYTCPFGCVWTEEDRDGYRWYTFYQSDNWIDYAREDGVEVDGSKYSVLNAYGLAQIAKLARDAGSFSGEVTLAADIDLAAHCWTPVAGFSGSFDGANHTIAGLNDGGDACAIENAAGDQVFALIGDGAGEFRNLVFSGVAISNSADAVAALLGSAAGSVTVEKVEVASGAVVGNGARTAGLIGFADGLTALTLKDCVNRAMIEAKASAADADGAYYAAGLAIIGGASASGASIVGGGSNASSGPFALTVTGNRNYGEIVCTVRCRAENCGNAAEILCGSVEGAVFPEATLTISGNCETAEDGKVYVNLADCRERARSLPEGYKRYIEANDSTAKLIDPVYMTARMTGAYYENGAENTAGEVIDEISAAAANATVTVAENLVIQTPIVIDRDLTIDLGGKIIEEAFGGYAFQPVDGAKLTLISSGATATVVASNGMWVAGVENTAWTKSNVNFVEWPINEYWNLDYYWVNAQAMTGPAMAAAAIRTDTEVTVQEGALLSLDAVNHTLCYGGVEVAKFADYYAITTETRGDGTIVYKVELDPAAAPEIAAFDPGAAAAGGSIEVSGTRAGLEYSLQFVANLAEEWQTAGDGWKRVAADGEAVAFDLPAGDGAGFYRIAVREAE